MKHRKSQRQHLAWVRRWPVALLSIWLVLSGRGPAYSGALSGGRRSLSRCSRRGFSEISFSGTAPSRSIRASPAAQVQAALVVDLQHLHLDNVAHVHHIGDLFRALHVQAGNVYQPLLARGNLHKGAEVHQPGDPAIVVGARLRIVDNGIHNIQGPLALLQIQPEMNT